MIDECELDQIINVRNQFGPNRYQVVSESLFFENHELVQQTAQQITQQQNREYRSKLDKNDRFMIFIMNMLEQQTFTQSWKVNSQVLDKYRQNNQTNVVITNLNKMIKEHIEIKQEQQAQQKKEVQKQDQNIIIIELEWYEIGQLQEDDFLQLLERKSTTNLDFWENQETLKQIYQKEISNQSIPQTQTLIYVTKKQIQYNDIRNHFEQNYIIKQNADKTEELCQDITNSPAQKFIPLIIFNSLFTDQIINPILEISKLNRQVNFQEIKNYLGGQQIKPIEIFFKLIQIFENCKQIQRWIKLLSKYLQERSSKQTVAVQNHDEKIQRIKSYLQSCYKQYDKRFQDEFYDIMKKDALEKFYNSTNLLENNQPSKDGTSTSFSIVLYEIKENSLMLYQSFKITSEFFYVLAKLDFPAQQINQDYSSKKNQINSLETTQIKDVDSEQIDLEQMSLVNKEDKKTVYILKFLLKEENQQLILNKNEQYRNLIMEVIMRCVAFKVKQTMYNPTTRKFASKITQYIEI